MESGAVGHNFEMGLPKDYPSQIWFNLLKIEFLQLPIAALVLSQNELKF
jgi:hypothetical protein